MKPVYLSHFAGINNVLDPERVHSMPTRDNPSVDLVDAVNVDLDDSGQVKRRSGLTLKHAGAAHSLWSKGDECLFVQAGALKRLNPDFTSTVLATGLTAAAPNNYVEVNGRTYFTNGFQTGLVDGLVRTWGMEAAPAPMVAAIAGNLAAGKYQCAMTYLRNDGQESGTLGGEQITLADGQGIRFHWNAPSDPAIIGVKLYLSEPNGMVLYEAALLQASAEIGYVVGPDLSLPMNTQWLDKPPAGQALAYSNGRIFIAQGDFVFATNAFGYEYCDLRDYLAIDGTRIGFMVGMPNGLFIGTATAVYYASGKRLDEFTLTMVVPSPCVPRSAVLADGIAVTDDSKMAGRSVALFATADGVHMGMEDGSVVNKTSYRYRFDVTDFGAAVFRETDLLKQYLLFMS